MEWAAGSPEMVKPGGDGDGHWRQRGAPGQWAARFGKGRERKWRRER